MYCMLYGLATKPGCDTHQHLLMAKILKHGGNFWITPDHRPPSIYYLTTPEMYTLQCIQTLLNTKNTINVHLYAQIHVYVHILE